MASTYGKYGKYGKWISKHSKYYEEYSICTVNYGKWISKHSEYSILMVSTVAYGKCYGAGWIPRCIFKWTKDGKY